MVKEVKVDLMKIAIGSDRRSFDVILKKFKRALDNGFNVNQRNEFKALDIEYFKKYLG